MERAEHGPLDVICQAGKYLLMIILPKAVEVPVNSFDIFRQ
jgi:hypothetical protein